MSTTLSFKDLIDLPEWRPLAVDPTATAAGHCVAWDLRNSADANPNVWHWNALTTLNLYNKFNDEWLTTAAFTTVGGSIAAGAGCIFVPSHGPSGTIGGTPTTTSFTLAALPNSASVGTNQLANQGNGRGFKIRVYGSGSGGSGKCEERLIVANTSGTTPVVTLDSALSFTPQTTDKYEILSGRVYLLGSGTTAAGFWKAYDVATGSISGNLATTNLASTIGTDFQAVVLDELYVPYNLNPGDGMISGSATYNGGLLKAVQATAADSTHITGSVMPATLLANEFQNFQIRVVEDTVTPTSVGQRRRISAHGSGASGQFTVSSAWTVTPSSSAKFVVENNNDLLLWTNAATVTYSYAAGGFAADANWSTAAASGGAMQYANPPAAMGAGCMAEASFGIVPDTAKNARNSHILWFRGATRDGQGNMAATNTLAQLDIANGANGTWTSLTAYGTLGPTFTTGASCAYDPSTNQGRYLYINGNATQRNYRFDLLNRVLEPFAYLRYAQGTAVLGGKLACYTFIDGATKLSFLWLLTSAGSTSFNVAIIR